MKDTYYTPDIADLFIGYECEIRNGASIKEHWVPHVLTPTTLNAVLKLKDKEDIRTPYLTEEQIEKEGWEKKDNKLNERQRLGWFPDYELKTTFGSLRLYINKLDNPSENITIGVYKTSNPDVVWSLSSKYTGYSGKCPSINEFRKICKLLGI